MVEIYKPTDVVTNAEVYEFLLEAKMKLQDSPKTLIEQMPLIQNWYNSAEKGS